MDIEFYVRTQRRSLLLVLLLTLAAGGFLVASALWPQSALARGIGRAPYLIPLGIVIFAVAHQTATRKHGMSVDSAEFRALIGDEWRSRNMERSTRGALVIALIAQLALPLVFLGLPTTRALWAMAAATITIGVAAHVALFLFFDRE